MVVKLLEELDIEGFRGIRRLEDPLRFAGFNVIVGRNGAGRTAILEAIHMLSGTRRPLPLAAVFELRKAPKESIVYGYSGVARLRYTLNWEGFTATMNVLQGQGVEVMDVEFRDFAVEVSDKWVTRASYLPAKSELAGRVAYPAGDADDFHARLGRLPTLYIPNHGGAYELIKVNLEEWGAWQSIAGRGLHVRAARELLAEAVHDEVTEVLLGARGLSARKVVDENVLYVDINSLGEGVRRAVLAYLAAEHWRPAILLWDDIDTAMHPGLLKPVLKWLAGSGMQVVVTTNNMDVLEAVAGIGPRDCKVIRLYKGGDDVVHYGEHTLEELRRALDAGYDVRY